ncbi:hypothetical protein [Sphingobium sp. YR768]|uniref:hypothetical protein n=1 Tax=Sphingobium sp. YR768 TaxID=1884365 RepID=UPI0008CE31FE|nr:hypothetical protein [Sphingobium sp. YR768]SER04076.1 hypothetical protein SAMN05518866_104208 [Sphingobium sp. YR768]
MPASLALPVILALCACGGSGLQTSVQAAGSTRYGQYPGTGYPRTDYDATSRLAGVENRIASLEQSLYNLALRLCRVEATLDPVTFSYPANGGVIMYRSGRAVRRC